MLAVFDEHHSDGADPRLGTTAYLLTGRDASELLFAMSESGGCGDLVPTTAMQKVTLRWHAHDPQPETQVASLSPREKDVLRALVDGLSYKMIADELGIGFETVRSHIKRLYGKLAVHNNTEAVVKTLQLGLLN